MIHIAVVDDEYIFREAISGIIIEKMKCLEIPCELHKLSDAQDLINLVESTPISLIFLDIDMPGFNGLDAGEYLFERKNNREIVYVSGYENYVFDALKYYPFDFVRKTHMQHEIPRAIENFIGVHRTDSIFINITSGYKTLRVLVKDILYISKMGRKTCITKSNEEPIYTWESMATIEKSCFDLGFSRISKDRIVNLKYVEGIEKGKITLNNGKTLPLSNEWLEVTVKQFLVYRRK
ncbi:LytR/AlgR family response regulator transcription factor [Robinsoniella peoriensis]|uniref:LytR/AlgR family response regulator transcription factor n=1 Tax=Robinsoniella peoriensis TaxID=180332 RepID=UPI00085C7DA6|nr:LytTR family DNA-binding domain-containing protein [Robinsoniella peoriensis]